MSVDAVRDFVMKVTESEELRDAWNAAAGAAGVSALGAEHGYDFTGAELEQVLGERELGEEELEQVAGGLTVQGDLPTAWKVSEMDGKSDNVVRGWKVTVDNIKL